MIFLSELLGPAKQPMACSSSSKRRIMNWETFQISGGKNNCLLLPVVLSNPKKASLWALLPKESPFLMCQRSVHLFFVMQIHILIQLAIRAIALEGAFVVSSSSSQSGIQYLWDEQRRPLSIASKMVSIVYHNGQFTAWWSLCKREVEVPFSTMASGLYEI